MHQEALRQLDIPKSAPLAVEVQCAAQKAMEKALAKPEIAGGCLKEVKQLIDNIIGLDQTFERVKTDLVKIDNSNIVFKPVERLQPVWTNLHQRFAFLVWDSRATTRKIAAYVKEFVNVILPGLEDIRSKVDCKNAADDLQEFAGRKDPFRGKFDSKHEVHRAQKQPRAFNDLRNDLASFKYGFDLFARGQGAELHEDTVDLYGAIVRLSSEIERCEAMIFPMSLALGVTTTTPTVGTHAIASLAALRLVGPVTAQKALLSGATAVPDESKSLITSVSKLTECKDAIFNAQARVNEFKAKARILERLQMSLRDHEAGIAETCERIDRLAAIWFCVSHDAKMIASDLIAVVHAEGDRSKQVDAQAFVARLMLVRRTYGVLATVLREYTSQLDAHSFRFAQGSLL
ncbi:hypothetical protein LshimejAT787_1901290 [Lyophyllum shimeji]|uniref:Uncharacterized protein n=1 Tax=Lyophyllum shimeji TaxID=47721 RepID=A0A9P3Q0J8_LYOSH|nr:hypothetical protein LshimejAT787_1901290 [Lyophyllum shimeji]